MKYFYKHIIFDLDGTLSDSREGIFNAYKHTIEKLDLSMPQNKQLTSLIGPPLQQGFSNVFGIAGDEIDEAVKIFRTYYADKGLYENSLYDGIEALLDDLVRSGALLYVATSKYIDYALKVLEHFNIRKYFVDISGADYHGNHALKVNLILELLRRNSIKSPDDVIIIGDTKFDIDAAAELEIDSVGIAYGFTTPEEITSFNPDYIAKNVNDLRSILLNES